MLWMTKGKIEKLIDTERVEAAIQAGEKRTSGEIRVSIAPWFWGNIERAADKAFVRLGMTRTREQNGILIFLVPSRRAFVVLGDAGIHARVGQAFWDSVAAAMSTHFRRGEFSAGLVLGVEKAAEQLAAHFPFDAQTDSNELPDAIDVARRA
jgi:uncharacterized membrane protein